jgi:hypothetical protein
LWSVLTVLKFSVAFHSKFAAEANLFAIPEVSYFFLVLSNKGFEGIEIV